MKLLRISAVFFYSTTRKAKDKQKSTSKIWVLDPSVVATLLFIRTLPKDKVRFGEMVDESEVNSKTNVTPFVSSNLGFDT